MFTRLMLFALLAFATPAASQVTPASFTKTQTTSPIVLAEQKDTFALANSRVFLYNNTLGLRSIELPKTAQVNLMRFSPDGKLLLVSGKRETHPKDRPAFLAICDVFGNTVLRVAQLRKRVVDLSFTDDGKVRVTTAGGIHILYLPIPKSTTNMIYANIH